MHTREKPASGKAEAIPVSPRKTQRNNPVQSNRHSKRTQVKRPRYHKQILIACIVVFLLLDLAILGFARFQKPAEVVAPSTDSLSLIAKELSSADIDGNIAQVGYDTSLTFASIDSLTFTDISQLQPIEDDLYKKEGGPDGSDLLYDEMIVWRIINFNSTWVDYLNKGARNVYSSVETSSAAETKLADMGVGSKVSFARLSFGEIRHIDNDYFIIVQADYSLIGTDNQSEIHSDVYVYHLVPSGNTMLIVDFELLNKTAPTSNA